jgi:hypothetical protein
MKKALLSLAALALSHIPAFAAVDLGYTVSRTPYESYMSPVKQVLGAVHDSDPSMARVAALMRQGRLFRYSHTDPYNPATPEETGRRRVGDCKDKALWLCDQLQDSSARFVIGKMKRDSRISHAWVMWQAEGGRWWILDCTMNFSPIPADSVSPDAYVPLYSYAKGAAFRHGGQSSSAVASVAGRAKAPVASKSPVASKRGVATKEPVAAGGVRLAAN